MTDWRAGDIAKCVDIRPIRLPLRMQVHAGGQFLRLGMIYPVSAVIDDDVSGRVLLDVSAQHGPKLACRFVKVQPIEETAEAQREVTA